MGEAEKIEEVLNEEERKIVIGNSLLLLLINSQNNVLLGKKKILCCVGKKRAGTIFKIYKVMWHYWQFQSHGIWMVLEN